MGEDSVDHSGLGNEGDDAHLVSAAGTPERVDLKDPAQQLRPAAAGFRERGRHELGLHSRGLLAGASPAPDAAGPVGVPAIVALEHYKGNNNNNERLGYMLRYLVINYV